VAGDAGGQVLNETGIARVKGLSKANQNCVAHVRAWLAELLDGGHLPPVDRAAAGAVLGRLGDRRQGVGLTDAGLPDIDWIEIPKGEFWMGHKEDWGGGQRWKCKLLTQPYRIARYLVTVAQFQAFVDAGGYGQEQCWQEAQAAGYWKDGKVRSRDWNLGAEKEWRDAPGNSGEAFRSPNSPVVDINWFEAVAFCHWLNEHVVAADVSPRQSQGSAPTHVGGYVIRLPSEAQWNAPPGTPMAAPIRGATRLMTCRSAVTSRIPASATPAPSACSQAAGRSVARTTSPATSGSGAAPNTAETTKTTSAKLTIRWLEQAPVG
jgi:hypothetical protein